MLGYIIDERGEEVISERHQKDFDRIKSLNIAEEKDKDFTDLNFDDI